MEFTERRLWVDKSGFPELNQRPLCIEAQIRSQFFGVSRVSSRDSTETKSLSSAKTRLSLISRLDPLSYCQRLFWGSTVIVLQALVRTY